MSNRFRAIAEYLEAKNVATTTDNLFVGSLPPEPDTCLIITPYPGIPKSENILAPYDTFNFQVMTRGATWEAAYNLIMAAYDVLQNTGGMINGFWFVEIVALQQSPFDMGKDALNRSMFTLNFRGEVENKTQNRGN